MSRKREATKTSSFGVSKRESHDSQGFYSRKMVEPIHEKRGNAPVNIVPVELLDSINCVDSRSMPLPDACIQLMVTSPPYNVGKDYDDDLNLQEYRSLLGDVLAETYRVLVDGGRACVNIANVGRRPYIPLHAIVIEEMQDLGFLMRGEIIWQKAAGAGASTAWGSWMSASNPTLRDVHEYIMVFSKGRMGRSKGKSSISRDEFLEYTKSVWSFQPESAKKVGHPAPFPLELPYRLIQLYSYRGDVVLDPFCGSGTTCLAARQTGRHYVGFDNNEDYVELAQGRLKDYVSD